MADRYWVGGTGTWTLTGTTNWSDTSGGAGGFSAPTNNDNAFFDGNSGGGTVTVSGARSVLDITFTGFTGTLTGSGTPIIDFYGNCTLATTMTVDSTVGPNFRKFGTAAGTFTSAGKTIRFFELVSASTLTLADAMVSAGSITVTQGTFTTNNYAVTASSLSSSNSNTRTINLGSSTVTLSSNSGWNCSTSTNLTLNAGTSSIVLTSTSPSLAGGGRTYNNVSFTSTTGLTPVIDGANTFNDLSFAGRTSAGISNAVFSADQTINGTLTLSAGTNATMRTFVRSDTIGTTRTLTCANFVGTDADFRDITITGAAAPVSGTRLGDCKGNSGITFPAAKTVYWSSNSGGNWGSSGWSNVTTIGSGSPIYFPLAQDTATLSSSPLSGVTLTINAAYNIGTIDMSARTTNTMTLATGTQAPAIYGDWINGTGTTLTGSGQMIFAGRGSQTITSAGKTFTQLIQINALGGTVTLQDAFTSGSGNASALTLRYGTFDANGYNVTIPGGFNTNFTDTRSLNLRYGTLSISGTGNAWNAASAIGLTVSGTGTISLNSASAKTFLGGDIQTYPTINQGGTGTLTISGSNKFADITNTAIGRVRFTGGTTNEFTSFSLGGVSGNLLQLGSTNTTQVTLKKPTAWNVGANSTDAGNNTGLSFTAGGNDYLSVSYVNGVVTAAPTSSIYYGATNVTAIYYGSTPVTAIYYGSTQVF